MLIITKNCVEFECMVVGATGSPVCGRGETVAEAVGDWAIQSGTVKVMTALPCYWDYYKADDVRTFKPIDTRD
jgi:hypothetical protein